MEKDLWKKGQETGNGYGWRLKGTDGPLAGMSHGNSWISDGLCSVV